MQKNVLVKHHITIKSKEIKNKKGGGAKNLKALRPKLINNEQIPFIDLIPFSLITNSFYKYWLEYSIFYIKF